MQKTLWTILFIGLTGMLWSSRARAQTDEDKIRHLLRSKAEAKSASKNLKKMCDHGNGEACSERGAIYEFGIGGMRKNRRTASNLYQKGCELDDSLGCALLGVMYVNGDYVDQDQKKGKRLLKKSCKLGFDEACHILEKLSR